MDQDNILTPPAPQDNTSTSLPPPVDTNTSPSAPDSGTSLEDSQHFPSNSADKEKSVEILPPEPERAASPDASTAAIQSFPLRFYAAAAPSTIEEFWTHYKTNREACDATDREFSSFSSYGSKATTQESGDNKLIVVYFRFKPDMEKAIAAPITSLHDLQRAHVALLAGLPRGSVAADLSEIAEEVSAKSVNIPFSYNSYTPKPYAYVHFSSAATKESYADAAGRKVPFRSQSRPRSSRSRSRPNNCRYPHRPSQSELDHDVAAMDVPPLMDWQQITDQITIILEEISHLTTEFAQLQHRVKWLEDQHSSSPPPIPRSPQPQAPLVPVPEPMNQG
ncbi:hypothetical protein GLOIN_2v1785090 [Rhizophagus irregularis DAOM 181602=DAOM 197198]|nr:hypothetical protein GLOIN_2v1785090 [Rhizophagus irregularis DAOM 181602=DAOM 197198]